MGEQMKDQLRIFASAELLQHIQKIEECLDCMIASRIKLRKMREQSEDDEFLDRSIKDLEAKIDVVRRDLIGMQIYYIQNLGGYRAEKVITGLIDSCDNVFFVTSAMCGVLPPVPMHRKNAAETLGDYDPGIHGPCLIQYATDNKSLYFGQ